MDQVQANIEMQNRVDNSVLQLKQQHSNLEEKLDYWIMAVETAAVGFSVQQTAGKEWHCRTLWLGFAVITWGIGFFTGYWRQRALISNVIANYDAVKNIDPRGLRLGSTLLTDSPQFRGKADSLARRHICLFMIGAVLFLIWHVLEMCNYVPPVKPPVVP